MISVTGYYRGKPLVYGRADTEEDARKNAKKYSEQACSQFPRLDDPTCWEFKVDAVDRQIFQPAPHARSLSEAAIAASEM